MLALDAVSSALAPHPHVRSECQCSFSQNGEDIVIANALLSVTERGIFVDIGAYHPFRFSNTFAMYLHGWRGINVDANEDAIAEFQRFRPDDINICALVSDKVEDLSYFRFNEGAWNCANPEAAANLIQRNDPNCQLRDSHTMRTRLLNDILAEHAHGRRIDLLTIDVEGLDDRLLTSVDLHHYRPRVLAVELSMEQWSSGPVWEHLNSAGYALYAQCLHTAVFTLKDT